MNTIYELVSARSVSACRTFILTRCDERATYSKQSRAQALAPQHIDSVVAAGLAKFGLVSPLFVCLFVCEWLLAAQNRSINQSLMHFGIIGMNSESARSAAVLVWVAMQSAV
jgi:hypothetical protein